MDRVCRVCMAQYYHQLLVIILFIYFTYLFIFYLFHLDVQHFLWSEYEFSNSG